MKVLELRFLKRNIIILNDKNNRLKCFNDKRVG